MELSIKEKNMQDLSEFRKSMWNKPVLRHLFFELTDRCNLHCRHCFGNFSPAGSQSLRPDVIERTLESVASRYTSNEILVNLTGGEPLLYPGIFDVVHMAKEFCFGVGMISNGTLINLLAAKRLAQSGLDTIGISLDGVGEVHERFRNVKGCYSATIMGIYALKETGFEPEVVTIVHKDNFSRLEEIYEQLRKMEIRSWRISNIDPIGRAVKNRNLLLDGKQFMQLLNFIRQKRFDNRNPMEINYGCSHFVTYEYERMVRNSYFQCGAGTAIGSVLSNGDISACPNIERRPELIQGNAYFDDFTHIWENCFQQFRFDRSDQCILCRICKHKPVCMGDSAHTWDYETKKPLYCVAKILEE